MLGIDIVFYLFYVVYVYKKENIMIVSFKMFFRKKKFF